MPEEKLNSSKLIGMMKNSAPSNPVMVADESKYDPGSGFTIDPNPQYATENIEDLYESRAQMQGAADKWGNGVVKLIGKTGTAVVGGVGMIGSVAYNVAGQLEDLWTGVDDTSFKQIYDNDFYNALNKANEAMDEDFKHYVTREAQEYSAFEKMGTANFWSNDFLQGASFVVGAVLTEGAFAAMANVGKLNNLTKAIRAVDKAVGATDNVVGSVGSMMSKSAIKQTGYEAATLGRQMLTSAGYESAVEANSFVKDAKEKWLLDFTEKNRREPTAEETAAAMDEIYKVGNSVFGINLIVTGLTQAKSIPGMFSPKLGKMLGSTYNPEKKFLKDMVQTATLTDKQLIRAAKNLGKTVDEVKAMPNISKYAILTGGEKFARGAVRGLEGAVFEGGQEGLQKAISYAGEDYLQDRFDPSESEDIIKSGIAGLTKAFGNNAESWTEIFIGAILGSAGGPGPSGSRLKGWQGGIIEAFRDPANSPELNSFIDLANNYAANSEGIMNNYIKHFNLITNSQLKKDNFAEQNDVYNYKSEEAKQMFDYLNMMSKMDRLSEVEEKYLAELNKLTKEQFQERYGYENLTEKDFLKRKTDINLNIKEQIESVKNSRDKASGIYRGGDVDVLDQIAYTVYANKNLSDRKKQMLSEISNTLNKAVSQRTAEISKMANFKEIRDLQYSINQLKNSRVEPQSEQAQVDQIVKLEAELDKLLEKTYNKELKNTAPDAKLAKDFQKFKTDVLFHIEDFNSVSEDIENVDPIDKADIQKKLDDIGKILNQEQEYAKLFNRLLTREGIQSLEESVNKLKDDIVKEHIELQDYLMFEKFKKEDPNKKLFEAQEQILKQKRKKVNFDVAVSAQVQNTIEELNEMKSLINDLSLEDNMKESLTAAFEKLHEILATYETISTEEGKKTFLQNQIKPMFEDFKNRLKFLEIYSPESYNKVIGSEIYTKLNNLIKSLGVTTPTNSSATLSPVNSDPSRLQTMEWLSSPEVDAIKNTVTDIDEKLNFKIVKEDLGEGHPDFALPNNQIGESMVGTGVMVAKGIPELKEMMGDTAPGVKYAIEVYYENTLVGYLNTPNKYRFGQNMDEFNGSPEHLSMLNPKYVMTDEATGEIIPSRKGLEFISIYKNSVEAFNRLLTQAKDNDKTEFTNEELTTIYDINFDYSGMKSESISVDDLTKIANGNTVSNLADIFEDIPDGLPERGMIIFNKYLDKFYVYDPVTKTAQNVPEAYNYYLTNYFSYALSKIRDNNFAVSALYKIRGKELFTVFKDEALDVDNVDFNEELNKDLDRIVDELKKLKDEYKLTTLFKDGNLVKLQSEIENKYRFTSAGRNYKLNFIVKKVNDEPVIELQLSISKEGSGFTNVTLGIYNLDKQLIPYVKGSGYGNKKQGVLPTEFAFLFTKDGLKYNKKTLRTSKEFLEALNAKIKNNLQYKKNQLAKNPNDDYAKNDIVNLSYVDPNTGNQEVATIQNVKRNLSSEDIVSNLDKFNTVKLPELKVTFTKKSGVIDSEIETAIEKALATTDKTQDKYLTSTLDLLNYTFNNQNEETKNAYRIKYNNAANHLNKLINDRLKFRQQGQQTSVSEIVIGNFKTKFDSTTNLWKIYDLQDNSLGLSFKTKEEAVKELELTEIQQKVQDILLTEDNYLNWSNIRDKSDYDKFEDAVNFLMSNIDQAASKKILTKQDIEDIWSNHKVGRNTKTKDAVISLLLKMQELSTKQPTQQAPPQPPAQPPADDSSSGPLGTFYASDVLSTENEEIAAKRERLLQILPDWISIKDIDTVLEGLSKSGFTYGMFRNSAIYLAKNAPKGVEYHEAFHAVFRVLLTDSQISKVLSEARVKYGVPTAEQLKDLKSKSPKYSKLTKEQLTNLYYEERMADDFMDYMHSSKPMKSDSFIKKMFDKIINFIRNMFGLGNVKQPLSSEIEQLFEDIATGKFKSAPKVKQSIIPLDVDAYKLLKNNDNSFMDGKTTNNIINRVFFEVLEFKNNNGYFTQDIIYQFIDSVKNEIYSINNFTDLISKLAETNPSEALRVQNNIISIYDNIDNDYNKKEVVDVITKMMQMYKFFDYDIDDDLESEKGTELIQKSNQRIGGVDSLSKKLKQYIMFTPSLSDDFGFRLTDDEIRELVSNDSNPIGLRKSFMNYVDGFKLHASMERMLVNTSREQLLNKLYQLTHENMDLDSFYTRLATDIYTDLKLPIPADFKTALLEIPLSQLAKSPYFRMFVSGYNKHKVDSILNRYDKKTGQTKLHRSNLNDVQDNQLKIWYNDFRSSNFMGLSKSVITQAISDINANLLFDKPSRFDSAFNIVKQNLRDILKLNLSDTYIKLSLYHNNKALFQDVEPGSEIERIKKLYESYNDIQFLDKEIILKISSSIKFNSEGNVIAHHFTKSEKELEKDIEDNIEDIELNTTNLGAVSKVKNLALANSMFDASASPSTFTNVNNEKVYNHLYPNYITTLALIVRNKFSKSDFDFIDVFDYNQGFEMFKKFMVENNLASPLDDDLILNIYYRQLRNNPILNDKQVRKQFVDNFEVYINDGLKSQSFDASFKGIEFADSFFSLDSRAKILFNLNQYSNLEDNNIDKVVDGVRLYPITWTQNEGKSTQWSALAPDQLYINDIGELNDKALDYYRQLLKAELQRVFEEYQNIIDDAGVVNGYNLIKGTKEQKQEVIDKLTNLEDKETLLKEASKLRALKLTHFEVLKKINPEIYNNLILNAIQGNLNFDIQSIAGLMFDYHFKEFTEFLKSPDIRIISNIENMLPQYYTKDGGPDFNRLKQFFLNYFFNSASLNNIFIGDLNANVKDSTDLFKRYAGPNAAGPSQGFGESNVAVFKDVEIDGINTTDAQSMATMWWYMNQYLPTNGKWNSEIEAIYAKILKLEEITADELAILQDTGNLLNPRKTSAFTFNFYGKTSTAVLSRKEVSYVPENLREEFEREVVKLLPSSGLVYGTKAFNDQVKLVKSFYRPRKNTEELHNLLNKMEESGVDLAFFESAVKTIKYNIQDINSPGYSYMKINNEFIREQVITDSVKDEIVHGTQLMQLIWSEQVNDSLVVKFNGKDVNIGELRRTYKNLLGWRVTNGFETLYRAIIKNDKANYKVLLESFKQSIIEQGADPTLLELFNSLGEVPEYNLNNPRTLGMYEKMFMSFISKTVFSRKTAGHKFTLRTDYGHNVIRRSDDSVVSRQDYDANPEMFKDYEVTPLRLTQDPKNPNVKYAECKIPMQLASMIEIDENGFISSKAAEMLGIRIPSQDKHSMIYLKVVEVLPAELGPQIIMPKEIIKLSGADFDIDSEFARALEHFMSDGKIVEYGGYIAAKNNHVELAYGEYLESKFNAKEVKVQTNYLLKENAEYNQAVADYDMAKGVLSKTDKSNKETVRKMKQVIDTLKDTIKSYKYIASLQAMEYFNYPASYDAFKDKYEKQVLNNVKHFQEGNLSQIIPVTIEESNNHLLEIEKVFVNNTANSSIAETPASDTAATDFINKFYDVIEDPLVAIDYSTPQAVIKASNANAIGQQNIGIAALANVMFQYFKDNDTKIKDLGTIDTYKVNGIRINDLISTVITMAVDNAKFQYAIRFNLTPATQSVFVSMLMLKNDFQFTSALMVQPVLIEYAALESFKKSPIKNKKEEGEVGNNLFDLMAEYDSAESIYNYFPEGINYDILKKAKLYKQKVDNKQELLPDDLTEEQYRSVQKFVINTFSLYHEKTQSMFHFSRVLSLIKGLSSSIGEGIEGINESMERIGIEVKRNSTGELYLDHTPEYKEAMLDPDDASFPIDYLQIINGNSFLRAEVLAFFRTSQLLPKFFLSRTPLAMKMYEDVANNIKYMKTEDSEKLIRLINGYLSVTSFINKYDKDGNLIKFSDLIGTEEANSQLVDILRELKKYPDPVVSKNEFIRFLDYDKITYTGKNNNSLNGKTTYTLKVDSFAKLTPSESRKLTNAFQQLFVSTDPKVKDFANKIVFHILGKDLAMYRNNSYVSFIPPQVLRPFIQQIDTVHSELLTPSPNFKALFGIGEQELVNDFTEKFIRDINNTMSIRGNRRENIGRNTKNAMHNAYYKLSPQDKLIVEKDSVLKPLIEKLSLKDSELTKDDYEMYSPIKWTPTNDGFEVNIFKNFFTDDGQLRHPVVVKFNKKVLKSIGLFGYEVVEKNGKYFSNIIFPKGFNILFDDGKRLYFRTDLTVGKGTVSNNPNAGVKAVYTQTTTIGNKFITPYAFPIKDQVQEVVKPGEREYTPEKLTKQNMPVNGIFVFGSNTEGRHGKGAALTAKEEFGAKYGQAEGLQGQSFAIITKDLSKGERSISLDKIQSGIVNLLSEATKNPNKKYYVTKLGSSLAGYSIEEIKGIFEKLNNAFGINDNIILPKEYEVRTGKSTSSPTTPTTSNKPGLQPRAGQTTTIKTQPVSQTFTPGTKDYYKNLAKNGTKFQITFEGEVFEFVVDIIENNIEGKNKYVSFSKSVTTGDRKKAISTTPKQRGAYIQAESVIESFLNIEKENFNELLNDLKDIRFVEVKDVQPANKYKTNLFYMSIKGGLESQNLDWSYEQYIEWANSLTDEVLENELKCFGLIN